MPRLPTAENLGQRPSVRPGGGIARLNLETPNLQHEGVALANVGQALNDVSDVIAQLAQQEKQKVDSARTEEATNNYLNGLMELELGEREGYANIRGGEAVKQPLLETYTKKRTELKEKLRTDLGNVEQQLAFDQRANIADRSFDMKLYKHISEQSRVYKENVHAGVLETEQRMAAVNWQEPGQIELSVMRTRYEILRKARADGYNTDRPEDRQIIEGLMISAETGIHASVVSQMLSMGQDSAARAYFEKVKNNLTPEAVVKLDSVTRAAAIDGDAMRGADNAWEVHGPKGLGDPVRLDIMEADLRQQFAGKPKELKEAITYLRSRATAHNDAQREVDAGNKAAVLSKFHDGATINEIQTMPEYMELDGDSRTAVRDYMMNKGWTEQQRARAEAEYREGVKAQLSFSSYWELSNPDVLATLSEKQILALEPTLGQERTEDLIKAKRKLNDPAKVHEAKIDTELFNTIAADAGLEPYKTKKSTEEKEYLGRLKNHVETVIDQAQIDLGRKLKREEKETLMRSEMDKKVMYDKGMFSFEKEMPAAVITPAQRDSIRVPLADIDPGWVSDALNYMRSVGSIPMDMSDQKARLAVREVLERAYAVSITGGSSEEGRMILERRK